MTTISNFTAVTATSVTVNLAAYGADGTIDIQVSPRSDFQFCVCPVYNFARAAAISIPGLNQRGTYWMRARNRAASGAIESWSAAEAVRTLDAAAQATAPAAIMIEPVMLVLPEKPLQAIGSNTIAGYPESNMFRDSPVAWRGVQEAANQFSIYLRTAGQPIDTVALLNTNLPEAATIRVIGATTQANTNGLGTADFATAVLPARASANLPQRMGYHSLAPLGLVRGSYWYRILIENASLPGSMLHVEHLVFGLNRTSKNYASEKTETPTPLTSVDRKRSGIVDRVRGRPMRKVDFELQMLTEAQYESIYGDLWQRENDAVFVIPNTKAGGFLHDRMLYGDLGGGRIVNPTSPRFNRSFTINSLI